MELIVFENKNIIVVNKPMAILSVPSRLAERDCRPILAHLIKHLHFNDLYPVHRLDFEVSGLLIFAKSMQAQRELTFLFENHQVRKKYVAWSQDNPEARLKIKGAMIWKSRLVRGKKRVFEAPHGKLAITEAHLLGFRHWNGQPILSWHLFPETGRPQQLRFQMSQAGFPILGDKKYGSSIQFVDQGIALRCISLKILDPAVRNKLDIPTEFQLQIAEDHWQA